MARAVRLSVAMAGLLLAGATSATQAKECRGIAFPDHMQVGGSDLTLNGLGLRKATFLKVNVYVAALYVPRASSDSNSLIQSDGPQELILHFVRSVGVDDLRKAWREGFERVTQNQLAPLQMRIATLNSWMADVKAGERLQFVRQAHGIEVSVAGKVRGTLQGEDFARAFLGIWLGATPPNAELKSGLLGGQCE
jgi:Chalcone isomerase-like